MAEQWRIRFYRMAFGGVTTLGGYFGSPDASRWADITQYVREVSISRGRQNELDTIQVGQATLRLDNRDRRFDPTYNGSPYSGSLTPMAPIEIAYSPDGSTYYPLFTGHVERWPPLSEQPLNPEVQIGCVDWQANLARDLVAANFGSDDLSTDRMITLQEIAGQPPADFSTTGAATVASAVFDLADNKIRLAYIQEIVAAEGEPAVYYIANDGTQVFRSRYDALFGDPWTATSVTKPTWGDANSSTYYRQYADIRPSYDVDKVINNVSVTVGSLTGTASDTDSQGLFGLRSQSYSPILASTTTQDQLNDYAGRIIANQALPWVRFDSMTVKPYAGPTGLTEYWQHLLKADISWPMTVKVTPFTTSLATYTQDMIVEGIQHSIRPGRDWTIDYQLSPDKSSMWFRLGISQLPSLAAGLDQTASLWKHKGARLY